VNGHVIAGKLLAGGGRRYPIVDGVPDLTVGFESSAEQSTVETFGEEWARYDDFDGHMGSADLFTTFSGLTANEVRGKRILEVGCGGGRWLKVLSDMGADQVVGLEMSSAVRQAARRTRGLPRVDVVRGSALQMPFGQAFDLVVSIGVIHHLADPIEGVRNVGRVLRPRCLFVFWVYAWEGNRLYLSIATPLRLVTKRLPDAVLAPISRGLATVLWGYMRTVNRVAVRLGLSFPLRDYLRMLEPLRFKDLESVVYDQLGPQIARYPTQSEVTRWATAGGASVVLLHHRTGNSWQCHCRFDVTPPDL
jgi:SAM-dependent methyltransferase